MGGITDYVAVLLFRSEGKVVVWVVFVFIENIRFVLSIRICPSDDSQRQKDGWYLCHVLPYICRDWYIFAVWSTIKEEGMNT